MCIAKPQSGTSLGRPDVESSEKNGSDNGTWNEKASSCGTDMKAAHRMITPHARRQYAPWTIPRQKRGRRINLEAFSEDDLIASAPINAPLTLPKRQFDSGD